MKRVFAIAAILIVVGTAALVSSSAQEDPGNSLDRARIARLVQDLGSDQPEIRDQATQELQNVGAAALPALREAAKSTDAEVAYRAQTLIDAIEHGGRDRERVAAEDEEEGRPTRPQQRRRAPGRMGSNFAITFGGNRNFTLRRDADGSIELRTKTKKENGEEVEETYQADSVEEFVEKYPDVAREYGINKSRPGMFSFPDLGTPRAGKEQEEMIKGLQEDLMKELQEVLKQSRRSLEEMFKGFRDRGGMFKDRRFPFPDDFDKLFEEDGDPFGMDEDEEAEEEGTDGERDPADRGGAKPEIKRDGLFGGLFPERREVATLHDGMKVEYLSPALRAQLGIEGTEGVLVSEVQADGPGAQVGLKKFDVILRVNDQPVRASLEFRRVLKEAVASGHVVLDVIRKGEAQTLEVKGEALEAFKKSK